MNKDTARRAVEILTEYGYDVDGMDDGEIVDVLDGAVNDVVSQQATSINNGGPSTQVDYLIASAPEGEAEPTHYVAQFELSFFKYAPDTGGLVNTESAQTIHESVYAYVQELIHDDSLPFKFGPFCDGRQKTPDELRVMAAGIENPGDLTADELSQVESDIINYLLAMAGPED